MTVTNATSAGFIGVLSLVLFGASFAHANTYYSGYYLRPTCEISIVNNPQVSGYPTSAKLSWHSQNASTAFLSPDNVSVPLNDTRTVYPHGATRYAVTVYGKGGSYTCETWGTGITIGSQPTYSWTPIYSYPTTIAAPASYVQISQLPYTGFDFGPVGNAMYWAALGLIAMMASYVVVYGMPYSRLSLTLAREHRAFATQLQRLINTLSR